MLARQQERAVGRRLCESGVRGNREGDSGCVRALRCFVSTQAGAPCSFAASLGWRQKAVRLRARQRLCQSGTRGCSCRCPGIGGRKTRRGRSGRSRSDVSRAKRRTGPWKWLSVKWGALSLERKRLKQPAWASNGLGGLQLDRSLGRQRSQRSACRGRRVAAVRRRCGDETGQETWLQLRWLYFNL